MWLAQFAEQIKTKLKKILKFGIKLFENTLQYKQCFAYVDNFKM